MRLLLSDVVSRKTPSVVVPLNCGASEAGGSAGDAPPGSNRLERSSVVSCPETLRQRLTQPLSSQVRRALLVGFGVMLAVLVLSEMTLDIGYIVSHISHRVALAYWLAVGIILFRRHPKLTALDLWFIRWGLLPLVIATQPVAHWYWRYRGIIE